MEILPSPKRPSHLQSLRGNILSYSVSPNPDSFVNLVQIEESFQRKIHSCTYTWNCIHFFLLISIVILQRPGSCLSHVLCLLRTLTPIYGPVPVGGTQKVWCFSGRSDCKQTSSWSTVWGYLQNWQLTGSGLAIMTKTLIKNERFNGALHPKLMLPHTYSLLVLLQK